MENDGLSIGWLAVARAVQFTGCMLILSIFAFDRYLGLIFCNQRETAVQAKWRPIAQRMLAIGLTLALLSGVAWFVLVTIDMSDLPPSRAIQLASLLRVLNRTHFGWLWKMRGGYFTASIAAAIAWGLTRSHLASAAGLIASALLCASLAWTGHGQMGPHAQVHLLADVAHLLACAIWPVGLLPFAVLFYKLRESPDAVVLVQCFSNVFLVTVLLLTGSGLANAYVMVGMFSNLYETAYGRVLLSKLSLFAVMIVFGAMNRLRLVPAIRRGLTDPERLLQRNVLIELVLGATVLGVVGWLGQLPPGCMTM